MNDAQARAWLAGAWRAGVAAVHGETLLRRHTRLVGDVWHLDLPGRALRVRLPPTGGMGRLRLFAAGKAAASLARGAEAVLGARIAEGLVVVKHGHDEPLARSRLLQAGHPLPDDDSERAARAAFAFARASRPGDVCLVLLTGGASSLLAAPVAGLSLAQKSAVTRELLRSGADIHQVNVVRRHLSRIKGGWLAHALQPARVVTLAISDVPGDDPAAIASGPTVPDPSTYADALEVLRRYALGARVPGEALRHLESGARGELVETPKPGDAAFRDAAFHVVAALPDAVAAVARDALAAGCDVETMTTPLAGDTHARAREFATRLRALAAGRSPGAPPAVLVAGGETTLQVRGGGRGGRCHEFAAVAAGELAGRRGLLLLAAGSDGTDGPTDAAGAYADGATLARAAAAGLDAAALVRDNDTHPLLGATGDRFVSGPTGTNVMDLVLGIAFTA